MRPVFSLVIVLSISKGRDPISSTMYGKVLKFYLLQKAAGSCLNAGFALAHKRKNNDILNISTMLVRTV